MAKKRSKKVDTGMPMGLSYKPPSAAQQMKDAAHGMARTVVDVHPKIKKIRDHITRSVLGAAKKAVATSARSGGFGWPPPSAQPGVTPPGP